MIFGVVDVGVVDGQVFVGVGVEGVYDGVFLGWSQWDEVMGGNCGIGGGVIVVFVDEGLDVVGNVGVFVVLVEDEVGVIDDGVVGGWIGEDWNLFVGVGMVGGVGWWSYVVQGSGNVGLGWQVVVYMGNFGIVVDVYSIWVDIVEGVVGCFDG